MRRRRWATLSQQKLSTEAARAAVIAACLFPPGSSAYHGCKAGFVDAFRGEGRQADAGQSDLWRSGYQQGWLRGRSEVAHAH